MTPLLVVSGSPDVIVPLTVDDPPEIGVGSELGGGTELGGTELEGVELGGTEPPVESPGLVETSPLLWGADGAEVGIVTGGEVRPPDVEIVAGSEVGITLLVSIVGCEVGRIGERTLVAPEKMDDSTLPGSEVGDPGACEVMVSDDELEGEVTTAVSDVWEGGNSVMDGRLRGFEGSATEVGVAEGVVAG